MCSRAHASNGGTLPCDCPAPIQQVDIGDQGHRQTVQGVETACSVLLGNGDFNRPLGMFEAHRRQVPLLVCFHAIV